MAKIQDFQIASESSARMEHLDFTLEDKLDFIDCQFHEILDFVHCQISVITFHGL